MVNRPCPRNKSKWSEGLRMERFDAHGSHNEKVVTELKDLADRYEKAVEEEDRLTVGMRNRLL